MKALFRLNPRKRNQIFYGVAIAGAIGVFINATFLDTKYEELGRKVDWAKSIRSTKADVVSIFDKIRQLNDTEVAQVLTLGLNTRAATTNISVIKELDDTNLALDAIFSYINDAVRVEESQALNPALFANEPIKTKQIVGYSTHYTSNDRPEQMPIYKDVITGWKVTQFALPPGRYYIGHKPLPYDLSIRSWRWETQYLKNYIDIGNSPSIALMKHPPIGPLLDVAKAIKEDLSSGNLTRYGLSTELHYGKPWIRTPEAASVYNAFLKVHKAKRWLMLLAIKVDLGKRHRANLDLLEENYQKGFSLLPLPEIYHYNGFDVNPVLFKFKRLEAKSESEMEAINTLGANDPKFNATAPVFRKQDIDHDKNYIASYYTEASLAAHTNTINTCTSALNNIIDQLNAKSVVTSADITQHNSAANNIVSKCSRDLNLSEELGNYLSHIRYTEGMMAYFDRLAKKNEIRSRFVQRLNEVKAWQSGTGDHFLRLISLLRNPKIYQLIREANLIFSDNAPTADYVLDYYSTLQRLAVPTSDLDQLKGPNGSLVDQNIMAAITNIYYLMAIKQCEGKTVGAVVKVELRYFIDTPAYVCGSTDLSTAIKTRVKGLNAHMLSLATRLNIGRLYTVNSSFSGAAVAEGSPANVINRLLKWEELGSCTSAEYLAQRPNIVNSGYSPQEHYRKFGINEGMCNPNL